MQNEGKDFTFEFTSRPMGIRLRLIKLKEKHARIFGIPALGLFLSFVFCESMVPTMGEILKTIFICFIFWQGVYFIISSFRHRYPKIRQTGRRLKLTSLFVSLYILIADLSFRMVFNYFYPELMWDIESYPIHFLQNLFISILVAMIYELTYFYARWNQSNLEAEKLKTEQIVTQLESLKNQISPHFLFNSLNTLAAIIPENQDQAVRFTEKLSEVYRYILQYKDKELVTLRTELDFIRSYLFLLQIRYPYNLEVSYNIAESAMNNHIAPLTLQILVENAVKHNVISKSEPLHIEIYTNEEGRVVVENRLNLKTLALNSTKTGLENIRKRYHYLSEKSVEIIQNQHIFQVSVPLIQMTESESYA